MPISEISRRLLDAFDSWEVPAEMPRPRLFVPVGGLAELRKLPDSDSPEWERLAVFHPRPLTTSPALKARLLSRDHTRVEIAVPRAAGETRWTIRLRERSVTRL